MDLRAEIMSILEEHRGEYMSGEMLSGLLGVSRTAVWKAISKLRETGYPIRAVTNRGYALSAESDLLSVQGILRFIPEEERAKYNIELFHSIDSTSNEVKRRVALTPASDTLYGTVVVADEQKAGRGKTGAVFCSPAGDSIYLSFILPPITQQRMWDELHAPQKTSPRDVMYAAALAVCKTITAHETTGRVPRVAQVNDILLDGKKVCGILTEAFCNVESGAIDAFLLGIGVYINLPMDAMPNELRESGAVQLAEGKRGEFAAALIRNVFSMHATLSTPETRAETLTAYEGLSTK